jgi:hypothetical protein
VVRSIDAVFPYVRRFGAIELSGFHLFASMNPIPARTADELAMRIPPAAQADLLEWTSSNSLPAYIDLVLKKEISVKNSLNRDPRVRITDDQPFNEYFLLRRWRVLSF